MSYLAMSAAPIDDNDNNTTQYDNPINKKRQHHNKTQKFRQPSSDFNPEKVNSVLQSIHNNTPDDDDDTLGNYSSKGTVVTANHSDNFKPLNSFNFPDKPVSMGGARKKQEGFTVPQPINDEELKLQELQSAFMNEDQVKEYYNKLVPSHKNYNYPSSKTSNLSTNSYSQSQNDNNQLLIEKLNYMINLLEEQQDQKTGSVTEEVVLYSFLGVFIIFVIDSFTKVGKYVR